MDAETSPLRIAIVPGVTVAKWTRAWQQRHPELPLTVTPTPEDRQIAVLHESLAELSFVRLPVEREGLSVIRLYSEVPVVVVSKEHPLSVYESVTEAELAEETLRPEGAADAVEIVAAGAGVLRVPHSVARQYARKDVVAVPISDAAETEIAIAWIAEHTSPEIEEFVGIVRGRTAASSRGGQIAAAAPDDDAAASTQKAGLKKSTSPKAGQKQTAQQKAAQQTPSQRAAQKRRAIESKARGRTKGGRR